MRAVADTELRKFRTKVQCSSVTTTFTDVHPHRLTFRTLPITTLLDNLLVIWTPTVLVAKIPQWKYHERRGAALWMLIQSLQIRFAAEFDAARLEKNKKARTKRRAATEWDKMSDGVNESSGDEREEEDGNGVPEEVDKDAPSPPRKRKSGPLEDITNAPKRARAARAAPASMAEVSQSFKPQYKPRIRCNN